MNGLIKILSSVLEEYLGTRTDNLKKRVVAGLSFGFSRTLAVLIMALLAVVVLSVLAFAFIMLIGEAMDSFAAAAFIVAGVYFLAFIVLFIFRKKLFLKMFAKMFSELSDSLSPSDDFRSLALTLIHQFRNQLID
ncbi:MAG: hypothetical protein IKZ08_03640 [Bacteroidales bacterium]|nr:hypothetical protein [Bacteroidales bacterium]